MVIMVVHTTSVAVIFFTRATAVIIVIVVIRFAHAFFSIDPGGIVEVGVRSRPAGASGGVGDGGNIDGALHTED